MHFILRLRDEEKGTSQAGSVMMPFLHARFACILLKTNRMSAFVRNQREPSL